MIDVAVLWIVNEQGELLLAQRSYTKRQDPGVWGPAVTGKSEAGETFDEALVREVREELALGLADYTPLPLFVAEFDHPDGEVRKFAVYYAMFPKERTSRISYPSDEVEGITWFPIAEIRRMMAQSPEQLVPSANAVWPATFDALAKANVLSADS